jgi:hypothetical protein
MSSRLMRLNRVCEQDIDDQRSQTGPRKVFIPTLDIGLEFQLKDRLPTFEFFLCSKGGAQESTDEIEGRKVTRVVSLTLALLFSNGGSSI